LSPLLRVCEVSTVLFGVWTLVYHAVLALRAPAYVGGLAWAMAAIAIAAVHWRRRFRDGTDGRVLAAVAVLGTAAGVFTLFNCRPDADDLSFFHRALVQEHAAPYALDDTQHGVAGLPPLSPLHVMASYEPLVALVSRLLGLDPLSVYQNAAAAIAAMLLAAVLFLTYVQLGIAAWRSVACTGAALLFLLLDGNSHPSFGNSSLVRFWQGKAILWSLGLPMTTLFLLRWFDGARSRWHAAVLFSAGVSAIGLSNSAVFQIPILGMAAAAAAIVSRRCNAAAAMTGAAAVCAYPSTIAAALFTGVMPMPDMSAWLEGAAHWGTNLSYVFDGGLEILRSVVLLLVVPAAVLHGSARGFLLAFSAALVAIFANPLMGPVVISVVHPGAFWRLAYLFPLPLAAGLTVAAQSRTARAACLAGIAVIAVAFRSPIWAGTTAKAPMEYKFAPAECAFSRAVEPLVRGRYVLAPEPVAEVLTLMAPSSRCVACRMGGTLHAFRSAGMEDEGYLRIHAQYAVTRGEAEMVHRQAFLDVVRTRADAVVTRREHKAFIDALLRRPDASGGWFRAAESAGYVLFLRQKPVR
jgi:hypothetical protein